MISLQVIINGLLLGGLYACIASGFSLVWGVLNIINLLHGSFIVFGAYLAYFAHMVWGINPFVFAPIAGIVLFLFGYLLQRVVINRAIGQSVLITLTLTFGLNLVFNDAMIVAFSADYKKVLLENPLGVLETSWFVIPMDRLIATIESLCIVAAVWFIVRFTRLGRAIIAVRMDPEAASLMGIKTRNIFAITFGLSAFTACASGALLAAIFPISPLMAGGYLGKSFVICILGGLGSIPGAIVGGILLGLIESIAASTIGSDYMVTVAFVLLLALLYFRPTGLFGKRNFE
jgi:branched-chain amino acid transport system permease protein